MNPESRHPYSSQPPECQSPKGKYYRRRKRTQRPYAQEIADFLGEDFPAGEAKEQHLSDTLQEMVRRQHERVANGEFAPFLQRKNILSAFRKSSSFKEIHAEATAKVDTLGPQDYKDLLRGKVFAEIAYHVVSATASQGEGVVLPSDDVQHLMQLRHPKVEVIDGDFGTTSLGYTYVPDGLVIKDGAITQVLEYKSGAKVPENVLERQITGFRHFMADFSQLCDRDTKFVVVTACNNTNNFNRHARVEGRHLRVSTRDMVAFVENNFLNSPKSKRSNRSL